MYVLDTCTVVWWTLDPKRLSKRATVACEAIERRGGGVLSSISLWEVGVKVKNRKLDLGMSVEAYHELLKEMASLEIVPVDAATWLKGLALEWDNRDPADRTIVALAMLRGLPIVTRDDRIREFHASTVW